MKLKSGLWFFSLLLVSHYGLAQDKKATTNKTKQIQEKPKSPSEPAQTIAEPVDETQAPVEPTPKLAPPEVKKDLTTKDLRAQKKFFLMGTYAPVDLILSGKMGGSLGWVSDQKATWEFEYLKASVKAPSFLEDIGEMSDERISIIRRSYSDSNSYNFHYGLAYHNFAIRIGDSLLNRISGGAYPDISVLRVASWGALFGFGNRWIIDPGFTIGVDWFAWSQPLLVAKKESAFLDYSTNQADRDNVEKALSFLNYFPRWSVLKVSL